MKTPSFTETERRELTLLLLYLNAIDENAQHDFGDQADLHSWTTYAPEDLESLHQQALLVGHKGKKSVYLTSKGVEKAKALIEKYAP